MLDSTIMLLQPILRRSARVSCVPSWLITTVRGYSKTSQYIPSRAVEHRKIQNLLRTVYPPQETTRYVSQSGRDLNRAHEHHSEPASHVQITKRGRWSRKEKAFLSSKLSTCQDADEREIALQMSRTAEGVSRQIRKLKVAEMDPNPKLFRCISDEKLTETEKKTLKFRIDRILKGFMVSRMTKTWRHFLEQKPIKRWRKEILALISPSIGRILAASSPPTIADMKACKWEYTNALGVYAWFLPRKHSETFVHRYYIYVGSATRYGWGLSGRKSEHLGAKRSFRSLPLYLQDQSLAIQGSHFVALISKDLDSNDPAEIVETRRLLVLAEAVLTAWFGALRPTPKNSRERSLFRSVIPWAVEDTPYIGLCSHNPLLRDIRYPRGYST